MRSIGEPRAVVAGKDHERFPVNTGSFESVQNPTCAGVDFFDCVAINTCRAVPLELLRSRKRDMGQVVGEVKKERPITVPLNELHRFVGIPFRQSPLIDRRSITSLFAHERDIKVSRLGVSSRRSSCSRCRAERSYSCRVNTAGQTSSRSSDSSAETSEDGPDAICQQCPSRNRASQWCSSRGRPSVASFCRTLGAAPFANPYMPLRMGRRHVSSAALLGEQTGCT